MNTPVALFVFNRPHLTHRNVEVLRRVGITRLFVVADGPREGNPTDDAACRAVRTVLDDIDWPCTVERLYRERNVGLEANVELGLDWVFSQVDQAVVLEDDCIADPSFFRYCEELLGRYAADGRVWQIAGDNKGIPPEMFEGCSYGFAAWASVWGWATWADRWQRHRQEFPRAHVDAATRSTTAPPEREHPITLRRNALATDAGLRHFSFVAESTDGDAYGWDHHWWVTIMSHHGLCATPAINLVENDGFSEGATHTRAAKAPTPAQPMPFPLTHPQVRLTPGVSAELELIMVRTDGRLSRTVRRIIRPLWLRAVVRAVLTSRVVWPIVRRWVGR